jgi:DNA repair protein REV1
MLAASAQAKAISKDGRTLTQANFISLKNPARQRDAIAPDSPSKDEGLDQDYLAGLPEDIRREVVAEHRAARLRAFRLALQPKAKPNLPSLAAPNLPNLPRQPVRVERRIPVPKPEIVPFKQGSKKLRRELDLRKAIRGWVEEFEEEGPYPEDVDALKGYLGRVVAPGVDGGGVRGEGDVRKAVGLVKWFEYVVGELESEGEGKRSWVDAVERVKAGVSRAARQRGLGPVSFD